MGDVSEKVFIDDPSIFREIEKESPDDPLIIERGTDALPHRES